MVAYDTYGIILFGIDRQTRFQADVALPASPKIVDVPKTFAWVEAKFTELHVSGIGAVVAIILAIDVKFMEMFTAPIKDELENVMELGKGGSRRTRRRRQMSGLMPLMTIRS